MLRVFQQNSFPFSFYFFMKMLEIFLSLFEKSEVKFCGKIYSLAKRTLFSSFYMSHCTSLLLLDIKIFNLTLFIIFQNLAFNQIYFICIYVFLGSPKMRGTCCTKNWGTILVLMLITFDLAFLIFICFFLCEFFTFLVMNGPD